MTPAGELVEAIVARVAVKNPPFPIRLVVRDLGTLEVGLAAITLVPDRDTGLPSKVTHTRLLPRHQVEDFSRDRVEFERAILREVTELVRSVFIHEFDECFHIDGVRVRDPHAREAMP